MRPTRDEKEGHRADGIIEPDKLQSGIILILETNAKIFQFTMVKDGRAIVRSTGKSFKKDLPCQIIGSLDRDGTLFAGIVVKEKHLVISLPKGRYVTGLIRGASLQGPGYLYEMWQ